MSRVSARRSSGQAGGPGECLRPVVPASGTKLAHLDVVKRTPLFRRRRHLSSGPIRRGTRQRGMVHVRCLRLQVLLTPQLPGLAAGRTHGCWFRLRRANRSWPAARALWCGRDDFGGSLVLAWSSWLASGRRSDARQCLGRVRGRGVDRYRLVLTGRRAFGRGRRPQHNGPIDQIDLEPVATVQSKLLPQGGGQRNPPLIVEFKRRHERGFPRLYADAHDSAADVKQLAWLRYCIMLLAWQLAKGRKSAAHPASMVAPNRSAPLGRPHPLFMGENRDVFSPRAARNP